MKFDKLVEILQYDEKSDRYGYFLEIHAKVNFVKSEENESNNSNSVKTKISVEARYSNILNELFNNTQHYRIRFKGISFNIISFDNFMFENKTIKLTGVSSDG